MNKTGIKYNINTGGFIMIILWILILAAVIFGIFYYMKNVSSLASSTETPLEILKKRYAKGELTQGQYERMKEELK